MVEIQYLDGNAVEPIGEGNKIIVHICNNVGAWGAGFVLAVSNKWPHIKREYLSLFEHHRKPTLGSVQFVVAEKKIVIANLIGQDGIGRQNSPIRYVAIESGLEQIKTLAEKYHTSIHMPRIGCGLAGGKWEEIEPIIERVFEKSKVGITVYDFN